MCFVGYQIPHTSRKFLVLGCSGPAGETYSPGQCAVGPAGPPVGELGVGAVGSQEDGGPGRWVCPGTRLHQGPYAEH